MSNVIHGPTVAEVRAELERTDSAIDKSVKRDELRVLLRYRSEVLQELEAATKRADEAHAKFLSAAARRVASAARI